MPAWPPGASRSITIVRSPSDAPYTAAARPAGPAPTITVSYSAAAACVASPSSSATRRSSGRVTVLPSTTRSTGSSSSAGSGPPHCSAASGASGVIHAERDLVAVEEPAQLARTRASQRCPTHDRPRRRRVGRDALQAADPLARERAELDADLGRLGARSRGSRCASSRMSRAGSAARNAERERRPERDRHLAEEVAGARARRRPARSRRRARPSRGCPRALRRARARRRRARVLAGRRAGCPPRARESRSRSTRLRSAKIETPAISSAVSTA